MKTIRSLMTLAGLSVVLFALGAGGVKAQEGKVLSTTSFAGTFTLPIDAQWGAMTLPAGTYTLQYGTLYGSRFVEVRGTAKGSPKGVVLAVASGQTSATKNALVCARDGNALIVRALEMPALGESAEFAMPRGAHLVARQRNGGKGTLLAEAPMMIQRVPVKLSEK